MKKTLGIIFNIFWIIFVGLQSAIISAVTGLACCLTIVGIPFGIQHFKFIPLAFAPAGKAVVVRANKRPVLNFLWMIFGGFTSNLYFALLGLFFMCTIVGYPIALQLFKIASFCAAPFGAEIVIDGKYSSTKDTPYDHNVLATRILENPDRTIDTPTGASTSTRNYLLSFRDARFIEAEKKYKLTRIGYTLLAILIPIVAITYLILAFSGATEALYFKLFPENSGDNNMLAMYLSIILLPASYSKVIPIFTASSLAFAGTILSITRITTAHSALIGKVLSPNNLKWLISYYPDNTEIKSFFQASPTKMLKKLNVALSKNASRTPVIIEELNYSAEDDDTVDDILYIANNEEAEDGFDTIAAPVIEEAVPETTENENTTTAEAEVEATPGAEPTAEVELEATPEAEPTAEPEIEIEIVEEPIAPEAETVEAEPNAEKTEAADGTANV